MAPFSDELLSDHYARARELHGDFAISMGTFAEHIAAIVNRNSSPHITESAGTLPTTLNFLDLYLALACAQHRKGAWGRLGKIYRKTIDAWATCASANPQAARSLSVAVLNHAFEPDETGRSRIASYTGIYPLATWLRWILLGYVETGSCGRLP